MTTQTYRQKIFDFALDFYGTKPEYLWKSAPSYGVLRCDKNKKWYGVVMELSYATLGVKKQGKTDVLNLKIEPLMLGALLEQPGFFPAYHMHKGNWITVLLDGTVELEAVTSLLEHSYEMVEVLKG